ncbi:MAG: radical SAM protein [Elusimicrobiota bacterium]
MTQGRGAAAGDYRAPLFLAWQITNRCRGRCLHCCEESGPDKAWPDEMSKAESLSLSRQIAEMGIPYVAFGGGEPMSSPWIWDVFDILSNGRVEIKIETDGLLIGAAEADRLKDLGVACVQISIDGAKAATHEALRPGGSFDGAVQSFKLLERRGLSPEFVFVPTKINIGEIADAYELASDLGARTFVTGPLMRLGRAAGNWERLAPLETEWRRAADIVRNRAESKRGGPRLALYPWDIRQEMLSRLESPQAMILVVPNGRAKILNALPFSVADLKTRRLAQAWPDVVHAWKNEKVSDFIRRAQSDPSLLSHANECWDI